MTIITSIVNTVYTVSIDLFFRSIFLDLLTIEHLKFLYEMHVSRPSLLYPTVETQISVELDTVLKVCSF